MPEGDTIHRAARALHRVLEGRAVLGVRGTHPDPELWRIAGRTIERVDAIGKHLIIHLSGGATIRSHMRMSGSWHLYRPDERWRKGQHRARLVLETAEAIAVCFDAPTIEVIVGDVEAHPVLSTLGPDALADDFSPAPAALRWRAGPDRPIGEALLDQGAISGIGNIYKSESLHRARIHPFDPVSALSDEALIRLAKAARRVLSDRVPRGGRRLPVAPHAVYERRGLPCPRCGTPIERRMTGRPQRSTYFCPRCQPSLIPPRS